MLKWKVIKVWFWSLRKKRRICNHSWRQKCSRLQTESLYSSLIILSTETSILLFYSLLQTIYSYLPQESKELVMFGKDITQFVRRILRKELKQSSEKDVKNQKYDKRTHRKTMLFLFQKKNYSSDYFAFRKPSKRGFSVIWIKIPARFL